MFSGKGVGIRSTTSRESSITRQPERWRFSSMWIVPKAGENYRVDKRHVLTGGEPAFPQVEVNRSQPEPGRLIQGKTVDSWP
jgi:hypothetical protein